MVKCEILVVTKFSGLKLKIGCEKRSPRKILEILGKFQSFKKCFGGSDSCGIIGLKNVVVYKHFALTLRNRLRKTYSP